MVITLESDSDFLSNCHLNRLPKLVVGQRLSIPLSKICSVFVKRLANQHFTVSTPPGVSTRDTKKPEKLATPSFPDRTTFLPPKTTKSPKDPLVFRHYTKLCSVLMSPGLKSDILGGNYLPYRQQPPASSHILCSLAWLLYYTNKKNASFFLENRENF